MDLEEHTVESATEEYTRKVWLMRGEGPRRLCVFLDAELYLDRVGAPAILERLQKEGTVPPVACLFVSHLENAARHRDFTCSPSYSRFIAEDVVAWARASMPGIDSAGHLIVGLSLSGLAGAFLTLSYPAIFPRAIAQSGSFWWNNGWFAKNAGSFPAASRRFWLSVGDLETEFGVSHEPSGMRQEESQIASVTNAVAALQAAGATVHFNQYAGGHEIAPWADELPDALIWALALTPGPSPEGRGE